jgi:CIC family chloride channel protein
MIKPVYQKIINYLRTKLSRPQFIMLIATLVGLVSGILAVLLKTIVHYLQHSITTITASKFTYLLFPVAGLIITVLIINVFWVARLKEVLQWF